MSNKLIKTITLVYLALAIQGCGGGNSSSTGSTPTLPQAKQDIYVLGSSSLEYMNNALTKTANLNNYNVINYAKGGEYLYSMCLRVGAFPGTVKFKNNQIVLNTKNYLDADWPTDFYLKPFDVKINNNLGQIGIDQNGYYFIPKQVNDFYVDKNIFYPIQSLFPKVKNNSIFIVNLGKNNLLGNDPTLSTTQYVIEKSNQCISWIDKNLTSNILVVGFFTSTKPSLNLIDKVNIVNNSLSNTYTNHYFNIKSYMEGDQIWKDTTITPSTFDLQSQKNQAVPMSLSKDEVHVNEKTNLALSSKLIQFINNNFK